MATVAFKGSRYTTYLSFTPDFKPGDPEPQGYCDWHAWAEVQTKAKIPQRYCVGCCKWLFDHVPCACPEGTERHTLKQVKQVEREAKAFVKKNYTTAEQRYKADMKKATKGGP